MISAVGPTDRAVVVSHFHWDREWYRPFEYYRARLVDAVDRVLELLAADPDYHFLLDGQTVLLEDYLAVRPERRATLAAGLSAGRLAAGPWYVQPDTLLPSGEAHVRNLLAGRRSLVGLGPVSRVGYVPDSFGHPAQLPQILAGFGMSSFVYWRGNGDEIDTLGSSYRWVAPDGSAVTARLLTEGYFGAACLPDDVDLAVDELAAAWERIAAHGPGPVLLMNGFDHMLPDGHAGAVVRALAARTGVPVRHGLLEHALDAGGPDRRFQGELCGGRLTNLLPGVWSTRLPLKLANRTCEALLEGWLEPWAALASRLGLPDERPSIDEAWRRVLQCQAHDSICGCAVDSVARDVGVRLAGATALVRATLLRILERLAGLGVERRTPWTEALEVVVFNPSPHPRTDRVRVCVDPFPPMRLPLGRPEFPPLAIAAAGEPGFLMDGVPVRVVPTDDPERVRWVPGAVPFDLEFVARDVPGFGCRRFTLTPIAAAREIVDDGREIAVDDLRLVVGDDGTCSLRLGATTWGGLLALEDRGDRGDTYDFDPVDEARAPVLESVRCERRRHPSGLARLTVERVLSLPSGLDATRERRTADMVRCRVRIEAVLAPGVGRVDMTVSVDTLARDHRLRLLFPTGAREAGCRAATTFGVAERRAGAPSAVGWVHPAPSTFVQQGWLAAGGLMVVAPGLPEAEVLVDGTLAITVRRAVGWLARYDVRTRPIPAGPPMEAPGAQLPGSIVARMALLAEAVPATARDVELGLVGVLGGPAPVLSPDRALLALEPTSLVLSAVKPAEDGRGVVVRVLNPGREAVAARLRPGFPVAAVAGVRLDELPSGEGIVRDGEVFHFTVPPQALRSVRLT